MNLWEFSRKGPVLSEFQARQAAFEAVLEVIGKQQPERRLDPEDARRIYLKHGLWVPEKGGSKLRFRDRAYNGAIRTLEPHKRSG
jgi:hypothetical protein